MSATTSNPFGSTERARPHALRWSVYGALVLAAIAAAYLLSRRSAPPAAGTHDHAALSAAGDSARSVMLSPDEARRIGVTYAVVTIGPVRRVIRSVGQVALDETRVTAISTKVDGWVEHLNVDFTGQAVESGAPLLSIYSPMLVTAQDELLLAKKLERDVASGSASARTDATELVASARRRLAYWDVAPADIERIEQSGSTQRTLTLRAPRSGFVVEKDVVVGQKVMAGETLYKVADLSAVWLEGDVFEQDLPAIKLGEPVVAELQALPGQSFAGRIAYVYPTLDPETRTARVRIAIPNQAMQLKPGMFATIRITGAESPRALVVPRSAVLATGERSLVFLKRGSGMLEPRAVATGAATDSVIEILRGLSAGDTVVASATFLVDAESNLGTALGGMGNMPGMDMSAPTKIAPADTSRRR